MTGWILFITKKTEGDGFVSGDVVAKKDQIYSDKLRISELNLTCIDQATEQDRYDKLYEWAQFFKATE